MSAPPRIPGVGREVVRAHGRARDLARRLAGAGGGFEVRIFLNPEIVVVGDGAPDGGPELFIPADLNGAKLVAAAAFLAIAGAIELQVRNITQAVDMLTTPITVDAGQTTSYGSTTQSVPDASIIMAAGDAIGFDVDDADGDALGLIVALGFSL